MDHEVPYRENGCPHLLLKLACWMGEVNVGWEIEINNINYEITRMFKDCMAIREVKLDSTNAFI